MFSITTITQPYSTLLLFFQEPVHSSLSPAGSPRLPQTRLASLSLWLLSSAMGLLLVGHKQGCFWREESRSDSALFLPMSP